MQIKILAGRNFMVWAIGRIAEFSHGANYILRFIIGWAIKTKNTNQKRAIKRLLLLATVLC